MTTRDRPPSIPGNDEELEVALRFRAKQALRKRLNAIRRRVPEDRRSLRSVAVANKLETLDAWRDATTVAGYVAMRGEVDPSPALAAARSAGRQIVLPRVVEDADQMTFHVADGVLERHALGFDQPHRAAPPCPLAAIDVILVPALAADTRGHRLGYGAGYYDRVLPTLENAASIAIVFQFQLMAELPNTHGDVPVDVVVTDETIHEVISGGP